MLLLYMCRRREEETRGWELESNIFWRSTLFQEVREEEGKSAAIHRPG